MAAPSLKYAVGNAASTTTSSSMTNVQTTTPLTSTTNFQGASTPGEGMVLIDEGAATEEITYATGVSGGNLTTPLANRGLEGGSAQAHSSGVSVKGVLTAGMWNDLITALTNTLFTQSTGALKSGIAMTSPVLTTPQINDTSSDHQYIFAASELAADRTVTLPLLTGNDDFVFEDHTQTLTNKTLTDPKITRTINAPTDNYTLVLTDQSKIIGMNKGTAVNLTVPPNADVAFPTGTVIGVINVGAGQTTVVAGAGVTVNVNSTDTLLLTGQHSVAVLIKTATNTWYLAGDLQAA